MGANNKRLTTVDYHALAASREFVWLGTEAPKSSIKTRWQCPLGHEWDARYHTIASHFHGCPVCGGTSPKTLADYHSLAADRGFVLISDLPENCNNKTKLLWRCNEGHQWTSNFNNLQCGRGCPFCANVFRNLFQQIPAQSYAELASERGIRLVGDAPKSIHKPARWGCPIGHEWDASYANVKHGGTGCPYCAGKATKSLDDYEALARLRGFTFIDVIPANTKGRARWRCSYGHEWLTTYNAMKQGIGCPICSNKQPKAFEDYSQIAKAHGIEFTGSVPITTTAKTRWRCPNGHEWYTSYRTIHQGCGCPICVDIVNGHKVSKPQRDLHALLSGDLNFRVGKYAVDVALNIDGIPIAVEYDCWYWHEGNEQREQKRDAYLISQGWRVLHIRTNSEFPTQEQLDIGITELLDGARTAEIRLDWGG